MGKSSLYIFFIRKALNISVIPVVLVVSLLAVISSSPAHTSLASYPHLVQQQFQTIREIVIKNIEEKPRYAIWVTATAYSSTPEETDDTPCIAAKGYNLCRRDKENVIATNFLPIGTRVRFPDLDPTTVYTVVDRMNERFNDNRIDFWKSSKDRAHAFGKKRLLMEIY